MPQTMKQLAVVQLFTWLGLFCMWLFFVPAVARHVFGATDPTSPLYTEGVEWGRHLLRRLLDRLLRHRLRAPSLASKLSRKTTHALCSDLPARRLAVGLRHHDKYLLLLAR
jgi:maltose/moltooligosaccharide transporter